MVLAGRRRVFSGIRIRTSSGIGGKAEIVGTKVLTRGWNGTWKRAGVRLNLRNNSNQVIGSGKSVVQSYKKEEDTNYRSR